MRDDDLHAGVKAAFAQEVGDAKLSYARRRHLLKTATTAPREPSWRVLGGRAQKATLATALAVATLVLITVVALAFGVLRAPSPAHPTPTLRPAPSISATPSITPPPSPSPTAPTTGYATASQAAEAGVQASGLTLCSTPVQEAVDSATVAAFTYVVPPCGSPGGGEGLAVWVYQQGGTWYLYTWAANAFGPTGDGYPEIPMDTDGGCVNVHAAPSLDAPVVRCLDSSDYVAADTTAGGEAGTWNPPVFAGGAIWWHVSLDTGAAGGPMPLGWVELPYLVCGTGPLDLNTFCRQTASSSGYATSAGAATAGAEVSAQVVSAQGSAGHVVFTAASTAEYQFTSGPDDGAGSGIFFVYVYQQGGRWFPYTWAGSQQPNLPQGTQIEVHMNTGSGCVNLRSAPSTSATILSCLTASDWVVTLGPNNQPWYPPVWDGQNYWWYVATTGPINSATFGTLEQPQGWVALPYLVCGEGPHNLNLAC